MRRAIVCALIVVTALVVPALASAGTIKGTVTPLSIAPEVEVCLVETPPSETCASPGADGTYSLSDVPAGTPLRLEFMPSYRSRYAIQYYQGARTPEAATVIVLSPIAPVLEGADAALEPGGVIEGTVTAAAAPLAEVEVCVLGAATRVSYGCTRTDAGGGYQLGGLPPGIYRVGFWGEDSSAGYAPVYYGGAAVFTAGTPISVDAGSTNAGINATMTKGALIEGSVQAADDEVRLEGISVCLFAVSQARPSRCTFSGFGGLYSFSGISTGSYQVGYSLDSAEIGGESSSSDDDDYLPQYYGGVPDRDGAAILSLGPGEVLTGIDGHLHAPVLPPPAVPPGPPNRLTPAPIPIGEPQAGPKKLRCRRGYHRVTVKGAGHCVKKKHRAPRHKRKAGGRRGTHNRSPHR